MPCDGKSQREASRLVAVGASLTATPVITLVPLAGPVLAASRTDVVMLKLLLKFAAGLNVTPASSAFTSATAPVAVHTPVPALYVEVTAPEVAVFNAPAAAFDSVSVAVTFGLSISLTTMSVRFSGVSSV